MNMSKAFLFIVLSSLLQLTIPVEWMPINLPLLVSVFIGLSSGSGLGLLCGSTIGLVMDATVSPAFGLFTFSGALAGGTADFLSESFNREQIVTQVLAMAALTMIHELAVWQGAQWAGIEQISLDRFFWVFALPKVAAHAFLDIPAFVVLKFFMRTGRRGRFSRVPKTIRSFPHRG